MKDDSKFYIRKRERFEEVPSTDKPKNVVLKGFEDFDMFIHRTSEGWGITEGRTGLAAGKGKTQAEAIENAIKLAQNVESLETSIQYGIDNGGLSPRWGGKVEAGAIRDPLAERMAQNARDLHDNSEAFWQIFNVTLDRYWSNITRFDVVKFDREVVKSGDDESMSDIVKAKYGQAAVDLIQSLL
jgi:hypothetical protein